MSGLECIVFALCMGIGISQLKSSLLQSLLLVTIYCVMLILNIQYVGS